MSTQEEKNIKNKKTFGATLKKLREDRGLSLVDLASRSSLEKTAISRIENGRTNITLLTAIKLSTSLEVDIKELFDFVVEE